MGTRENAVDKDFSGIPLEEEVEEELKETAIISMGTEISPVDLLNIMSLCDQVYPLSNPISCCSSSMPNWPAFGRNSLFEVDLPSRKL